MKQGKKIIQPPYLKAGDKVALVSPAYWVPQEAIQQAAETIRGWGLQPVIGPHTNNMNVNAYAGTKIHLPQSQNVILFIEEVEESLHNIDRLFYRLRLQLDFERVKGIIFGTFSSVKYDLQYGSVEQMLIAHLSEYDIPVCCGFPVGSNSCIPLIEGAPCSLDVTTEQAVLTFNIQGSCQPYDIETPSQQLFK